jgi:glucose-1-phosphate thymidylyltransferase
MANLVRDAERFEDIIGLVPAAGLGNRISPLPCSKELYPVGFRPINENGTVRPKVVSHYLLEKMRLAGVKKAFIVLRDGKWDIPKYFGDGSMLDMSLAYLMMRLPYGAPYTADQAAPFLGNCLVAFGFPDILFGPDDAYCQLLKRQAATHADIVLGVFPADRPDTMDMVDVDENGWVRSLVIKPPRTSLRNAWIIAVWTPVFTRYQHDFLIKRLRGGGSRNSQQEEVAVGQVIQAAIQDGMRAQAVVFPDHGYLDIGTPENLFKAIEQSTKPLRIA